MINDIKLTSAMRNSLLNHQQIKDLTATVEKRLATGKKVNDILDGPVEYFKAKGLYDKADGLLRRKEGIDQAISALKGAQNGIDNSQLLLEQIKGLAEEARNASPVQKQILENQAKKLIKEYDKILKDASVNNVNLVYNEPNIIGAQHVQNVTPAGDAVALWGDSDFLYVSGRGSAPSVYEIDDVTGELTLTQSGGGTDSYDIWSDGEYLYSISNANRVYVYDIDRTTGTYTTVANYTLGTVQLTDVWGDDKYLFVANDSGGSTAELIVLERHADGTLTELDREEIANFTAPAAGTDPAGMFTDGDYTYLSTTRDGVHTFEVDPNTGQLTWIDEYDTFDARQITGDGENLFLADAGRDARSFYFDSATGQLIQNDGIDVNDNIYGIATDGTYYYGANSTTGITVYSLDDTGQITRETTLSPPAVNGNSQVDVWTNGTHVYYANYSTGVDVFDIRSNSFDITVDFSDTTFHTINGTNLSSYSLGIQAPTINFGSAEHIDGFIARMDTALNRMDSTAASFATDFALLQTRLELTEDLINTHEEAGDKLTLADLEEESANRLALETREQLSIFSMTNSNRSIQNLIDILFGGGS